MDEDRTPPPAFRRGPSLQDWLLLVIGAAFVLMGLAVLPKDPTAGLVTIAFFGSCLGVAVINVVRKRRYRRYAALAPAHVSVAGGVPIRPKKSIAVAMSLWLIGLGLIMAVAGARYPLAFRLIGVALMVLGAGMLVAIWKNWVPVGFLQFDPGALTLGYRGFSVRVPWDNIAAVSEGEYHSNPVLYLDLNDISLISADPPEALPKAMKLIATHRAWGGADLMFMTTQFGLDLPVLSETVLRYAQDQRARAGLQKRLA